MERGERDRLGVYKQINAYLSRSSLDVLGRTLHRDNGDNCGMR